MHLKCCGVNAFMAPQLHLTVCVNTSNVTSDAASVSCAPRPPYKGHIPNYVTFLTFCEFAGMFYVVYSIILKNVDMLKEKENKNM